MRITKRILVTGSSGYLGQHFLHHLLTHKPLSFGYDCVLHVYALYGTSKDFPQAVKEATNNGSKDVIVITESLDLTDTDAVKAWFQKQPPMDVCIHSAALSYPQICEQDYHQAYKLNVPKVFFQELQAQNCPIIALSTDQVYDGESSALYKETDPTQPVNTYGATKLAMETYLLDLFGKERAALLRSSVIFGKKAPIAAAHETFLHFCATRQGQPTDFYSDAFRSVVFVEDVVETLMFFTKHFIKRKDIDDNDAIGGAYNMGGPAAVSRVDMAEAVFDHLDYDKTNSIISVKREELPVGPFPSPLNSSMDTSKLEALMNRKFSGMDVIVQSTFPKPLQDGRVSVNN